MGGEEEGGKGGRPPIHIPGYATDDYDDDYYYYNIRRVIN